MTFRYQVLRSSLDGAYFVSLEAMTDEVLSYNLTAAAYDFKRNHGDKDQLLDVVNQWRAEAKRRHLVVGPRRVVPWLDRAPDQPLRPKLVGVVFDCPGCGCAHAISTTGKNDVGAQWSWNGNYERPTITPSILYRKVNEVTCHSTITNGVIKFLPDCTHSLANTEQELAEC